MSVICFIEPYEPLAIVGDGSKKRGATREGERRL